MNRRNPIDRFFSRKLQYYSTEAPMELWDRIDAERTLRKQEVLQVQKQRGVVALLLLVSISVSSMWWTSVRDVSTPSLNSFPIEIRPLARSSHIPATAIGPALPPAGADHASALPGSPRTQKVARLKPDSASPASPSSLPEMTIKSIQPPPPAPSSVTGAATRPSLLADMAALPNARPIIKLKSRFSEDIKCAEFSPDENGKWTLDILASPDWSFRRLEPKSRDYAEYVQNRKATESADFNYSAGLRVSYTHPSGFLGRVGLNYSQINEKFEHRTENEEVITIRNIFGPGGDVVGTDTLIETSVRRIFSNNRFESLDIPVIFGYEKDFKKLSLTVNAGMLFNIMFQSNGDFLSPMDGEPVSFGDGEPDSYPAFRDQLGVGVYAGVTLAYHISPKLQLIAEPHLKTYPKTITQDQYMVSQKYLLTGLSLGLRHQL